MSREPSSAESDYEWILVLPESKGYKPSNVDRRAIRRQAMRTVSTGWRKCDDHGRINMGQYPVFASDYTMSLEAARHEDGRVSAPESYLINSLPGAAVPATAWNWRRIPASMPLSGMERLRAMSGVDLLNLSTLTITHVGKAVRLFFSYPSRLASLLCQQRASYLSHIPSRFGNNLYLDSAIYALLAKVREVLNPSNPTARTVTLSEHRKALRALQEAINDPVCRTQPDVLCATGLLGLIEASWFPKLRYRSCINIAK
jgi:hypothetical protein